MENTSLKSIDEIVIDLNSANKSQKYKNNTGLFQIEAFKDVVEILEEYNFDQEQSDNITNCRVHNTIFIDGDRGVGKTAFMINIEDVYKREQKYKQEKTEFLFFNPVDPTLLEHTEKFLSVILARIIDKVNNDVKSNIIRTDNLENYYKKLEKLSISLSAIKTLPDDIGIDEIASNKSSLKLEQNAHEFFKEVSSLYKVKALVMLIDDIDMAFDKGFDVLEVVRKYLASPYLIPTVAGDMKLYKEIIETKFIENIKFKEDIETLKNLKDLAFEDKISLDKIYKNKRDLLNNLVEQYIHKLFPNEYHIKLEDIFTILKEYKGKIKVEINGRKIPYEDLKDFEIRVINWGINQKEFTHQVFTNNTRDFVQYIYHKKEIFEKVFDEEYDIEEYKESGKSYSIITDRLDELIKEKIIEVPTKHRKTLELTADFYRYSNDEDKKRLSLLLDNDVESFTSNGYSIYKALKGNFFMKEKTPYNKIDNEILRDKLYVPKERYSDIGQDTARHLALYLILHDNYYSNVTTKWLIITGKLLESIICIIDNSLEKEEKIEKINNLKYEIPIFAGINKNKYIENLSSDNSKFDKSLKDNDFSNFVNIFDTESNKLEELKFTSIFLHEMLKKYMNNINILKASKYSRKQDDINTEEVNQKILSTPIYDTVQRVLYILLNSISSFESKTPISIENIGVDGDVKNIKKYSKPFLNNIQKAEEGTLTKELLEIFKKELFLDNSTAESGKTIFSLSLKEVDIDSYITKLGFSTGITYIKRMEIIKKIIDKFENKEITKEFLEVLIGNNKFQKEFLDYKTGSKAFNDNKEKYNKVVQKLREKI